jgi:hypothetical protein
LYRDTSEQTLASEDGTLYLYAVLATKLNLSEPKRVRSDSINRFSIIRSVDAKKTDLGTTGNNNVASSVASNTRQSNT